MHRTRLAPAAIAATLITSVCQAALFSGPSSITTAPFSQLGPVTNNLVLTDNANGFVVSGQVIVSVPATSTPITGVLAAWEVDRPLDPTFGSATAFTSTVLSGYSAPPLGILGTTSGLVESHFTNFPNPSISMIPISLVNGAATWTNITVNSSSFAYTSGGTNFLHQRFQVDGIYLSGPGGAWVVDVPVTTIATLVPEPSSTVLAGLALAGLAGCAHWRRKRAS